MQWKSGRATAVLACLAAMPQVAPAAETAPPPDSSVVLLGEILVRSTRPVSTPGGSGAVTANIDSLALGAAPSMEDVLRSLPGAHVRTNSRGEAEVSVRGSESRQVAILLDGIPLTFSWDGRTDVSVIPAMAAQEVTFVRGLSTLMHGPNTLGGVVAFSTGAADPLVQKRKAQFAGGVDQVGAYQMAASVTVPRKVALGLFTARAGVGYRETPGSPLARNVAEPVPTNDKLRLNTDSRQSDAFLSLRMNSNRGAFVSLSGTGFSGERGIPAQLGVTTPRFWRYPHLARGIGVLSAGTGRHDLPWGGRGDLEVSGGLDKGHTEIDAYASRDYVAVVSHETGDTEAWTMRAVGSQTLGDGAHLQLGFTHGDIQHDEDIDTVLKRYRQKLWSLSAQTMLITPGVGALERFDVSLGVTYDGASTPLSGDKPSLGALQKWGGRAGIAARLPDGATTLHASVSQRARFPSLRELYSDALGTFDPNPNLQPENLLAGEAGVTSRTSRSAIQVLGFYHLLSDAVVRIRPPRMNYVRVNQEGIRSVGMELLGSHALGAVEVGGDLVAQQVTVLDPDAGLARPENMPELLGGLGVQLPTWAGLILGVDARYTGTQFAIDPNTGLDSELPAAMQLHVGLTRRWASGDASSWFSGLQARAAVHNLTDVAQYDAFGLPMAGRTLRLEFRLN